MRRWSVLLAIGLLSAAVAAGQASAAPYALPEERATLWNPGITSDPLGGPLGADGLPQRSTVCATIDAATYGNGARDATAGMNAAIAACPSGQVVQLSAGVFLINADYVRIEKSGVVLRGAGAGLTTLRRTNGAVMGSYQTNAAMPVVIIGASRWPHPDDATSRNLSADGAKGSYSITVASAVGFAPGQIVLLDEMTKGAWQALPNRNGSPTTARIWAGDRVIWQFHNPSASEDGPFGPVVSGNLTGDGAGWFMRQDRPVAEIKEIVSIAGNTLTFSDPLHIGYRISHNAQVTGFDSGPAVQGSGVEALTVQGGDDGNFHFENAARCWAKNVENTGWLGEGFAIVSSYRVVVRDSYVHDGAWPEPGGGGYALSLSNGSSEVLIENNISLNVNKVMVARSCGAGSVVGYNYMDNGMILTVPGWVEAGVNGSHMVGPHHMLFEGNYSFNADSDATWGSSIYHTFFRNHLSGHRLGGTVLGSTLEDPPDSVSVRCAGLGYGSRWMSFVGNVLGRPGQMSGWVYEQTGRGAGDPFAGVNAVWLLGYEANHWEQAGDPQVLDTVIRDGNYDFLTDSVHWHATPGFAGTLPDSLYLRSKPAFFGSNTWPWVDPLGATKLYTLPAKARFDAGIPNDRTLWLSVNDASVVESNAGPVTMTFTVNLSAPSDEQVTVDFATAARAALAARAGH